MAKKTQNQRSFKILLLAFLVLILFSLAQDILPAKFANGSGLLVMAFKLAIVLVALSWLYKYLKK